MKKLLFTLILGVGITGYVAAQSTKAAVEKVDNLEKRISELEDKKQLVTLTEKEAATLEALKKEYDNSLEKIYEKGVK